MTSFSYIVYFNLINVFIHLMVTQILCHTILLESVPNNNSFESLLLNVFRYLSMLSAS